MQILLTILAVFIVVLGSEFWWRRRIAHGEFSRKFVHITVGSFVAFWPWYLSWRQIELMSVAFLVVIVLSKELKIFQAIHSVQRPTWGEALFALAVGLTALIAQDKWVYAASLLTMSLADGLAAVAGVRFGGRQRYSVFGYAKSVVGTLTFFVVALAILLAYGHYGGDPLTLRRLILLSAGSSLMENLAVKGTDNLFIPLIMVVFLTYR